MTYTQTYYEPMEYLTTRQTGLSYIRILHASPDVSGVDVFLNNRLMAENLAYKNFTPYIGVNPGIYSVRVYPADQTYDPVIDTNIQIAPQSIYTTAAIGTLPDIELYIVPDPVIPPLMNRARIRFVHLSPTTPEVDITLSDGIPLFRNVVYKGVTDYKALTPGRYTIQARLPDTDNVVLNVPNVILRPGRNLSVYAVGLTGETPPLQFLIPLDGSTYLPI